MKTLPQASLSLLVVFAGVTPSAWGQGLPTAAPEDVGLSSQRLDRIVGVLEDHVDRHQIAGAVTLVARRGRVAHFEAFGRMDIESGRPMHEDALFRIASMTKPVTCVAVMMLYEEGRFLLNDPISRYIPEFKNPRVLVLYDADSESYTTVPAAREITIRHLLNHTSGLSYGKGPLARFFKEAGLEEITSRPGATIGEAVRKLAGLPLLHHPGERWVYSLSDDELESIGTYMWDGGTRTRFWVDPAEELIGIFMTQLQTRGWELQQKYRVLVYQAIVD
jgi:CubicO group peptidase (beta-lactamase class C family)